METLAPSVVESDKLNSAVEAAKAVVWAAMTAEEQADHDRIVAEYPVD